MNLDQLRIFLAVAKHRSFTKAAETLYISHSTTSRNVASLEEALEVRLLVRDNRSVKLTPAGELLCHEGSRILKKIESIEDAVRNAGQKLVGSLSVSSANLYSRALSFGCRNFLRCYPDVFLSMTHRSAREALDLVRTGGADVGVALAFTLPRDFGLLSTETIDSEHFCVAVPAGHPLEASKKLRPHEVNDSDASSPHGAKPGFCFESEAGNIPTPGALFSQFASENGVLFVPRPIAHEYGPGCTILDVDDDDIPLDIVMVWRRDNINPTLPLFLDIMAQGMGGA